MGWFRRKKKKVLYIPQGIVGYKRVEANNTWYFTIIVECIAVVNDKCKFKILEVDIDRDCGKTKAQCLYRWGAGDWIDKSYFTWETDEQRTIRMNEPYYVEPEVVEMGEEEYTLTRHNFTEQ